MNWEAIQALVEGIGALAVIVDNVPIQSAWNSRGRITTRTHSFRTQQQNTNDNSHGVPLFRW
jgi:hypothetical protein